MYKTRCFIYELELATQAASAKARGNNGTHCVGAG